MISLKTFNTVRYLQRIHGKLPVFSKHDAVTLPCIIYHRNKVEIIDDKGKQRYECAYLTNCPNVVYVDGGCKNGVANIGIYTDKGYKKQAFIELEEGHHNSLEAELAALIYVLKMEWSHSMEIRTDNRTCVGIFHGDLNRDIIQTPRVKEFIKLVSEFKRPLNIGWVKGHSDWEGNIQADKLTKTKRKN